MIGTDTHKRTHTCGVVDALTAAALGELTVAARAGSFGKLLRWARALDSERVWAIEDCRHVSGAFERFLIARGERIVRVAPKHMAGARRASRERGKSDSIDAFSVARAALKEGIENLPAAHLDGAALDIRLLVDHREDLIHSRTADQQRLRWHLHDLWPELEIPAGALDTAKWLGKASRRLARAQQTTRVRVARELVRQITARTTRIRELETELAALVDSYAPQLLAERGCGPLTAAKLIGEIAGADRFSTDSKLARTGGAAPIPASSGNTNRHRLDRGGNRQLNCALHRLAINKATWDPKAAAYLARKQAEGKSRKEALRCLKRHLARRVWQHLRAPASGQDPRSNNDTTINNTPAPIIGNAPYFMPCAR
ncbi:MAG TPA: IS110 family transposase [Solirubrobacteraceae bacterium]|nr:IS110 family transposase [Solirubrobacteraceae bacterium]